MRQTAQGAAEHKCRRQRFCVVLWIVSLALTLGLGGCSVFCPLIILGFDDSASRRGPDLLRQCGQGRSILVCIRETGVVKGRFAGIVRRGSMNAWAKDDSIDVVIIRGDSTVTEFPLKDVRWYRAHSATRTVLPAFLLGCTVDYLLWRNISLLGR